MKSLFSAITTHPALRAPLPGWEIYKAPLLGGGWGWVVLVLFIFSSPVFAVEDENLLFDEATPVIATASPTAISVFNAVKSVTFSGRLDSFQLFSSKLGSYTQGDLFLDIRLPKEVKAFADISLLTSPVTSANSGVFADIKELFVDYNFDKQVYVRTGKQFVTWGRGYFWNPVDFVNQSHQNFLNLDAVRSGVSGIRVHVPRPNQENAYVFVDMSRASELKGLAAVMKYEGLMGTTEWGLSMWTQSEKDMRFGLDFSTRLADLDLTGEVAVKSATRSPSAVLGVSKQFNWERPSRITVHYETFYNGFGYANSGTQNIYHAAFITISEFPIYQTTFTCNVLQNLSDGSGILSTGVGYPIVEGLKINNAVLVYFGPRDGEYRRDGNSIAFLAQGILTF